MAKDSGKIQAVIQQQEMKEEDENCEIVILSMLSCNLLFMKEFRILKAYFNNMKETLKHHFTYIGYIGNSNEDFYDDETRILHLSCPDDVNHTFEKTQKALFFVNEHFSKYRFVFRTNTSTVVNLRLLDRFIDTDIKPYNIYTSEIYRNDSIDNLKLSGLKPCMYYYLFDLYGRGNGLLLSEKIISEAILRADCRGYSVDDYSIGCIMNMYWRRNGMSAFKSLVQIPHAWAESMKKGFRSRFGNLWCKWGNDDYSFDFLKRFITVQVKAYDEKSRNDKEIGRMEKIIKVFQNGNDKEIKKTVSFIHNDYEIFNTIFINIDKGYVNLNKI